jgi:hypothetical protein
MGVRLRARRARGQLVSRCAFPGCPNPEIPDDYPSSMLRWEITGWETGTHTRATGTRGGSDVSLRRRTGAVAHSTCVDQAKRGLSGQQTLA